MFYFGRYCGSLEPRQINRGVYMRPVIVDMGAGSTSFLRLLRRNNKNLRMLMFAGEPEWKAPNITKRQLAALISDEKSTGIHRIVSRYGDMAFPDESVDLITLNSPHGTFVLEHRMFEREAVRCLKPNGYLFFDFTSDRYLFESRLTRIAKGVFRDNKEPTDISAFVNLPSHIPNKISPGRVMSEIMNQTKDPLWGELMRKIHTPTFELWQKLA